MSKIKGYYTNSVYLGFIPSIGKFQQFETEREYINYLKVNVNKELSSQNRIDSVELQEENFERTATQKIKRFLYPKKK